jgi:polyphosphate kinase
MTRNTTRRLEIAAPVFDEKIKTELEDMFDLYFKDNVKSRELQSNGAYEKIGGVFSDYIDAQHELFEE